MRFQNTLSFAAALSLGSAHTIFTQLEVEGTTYPISYAIRDPTYDGPITDVTTNYIACNGGPNPTMSSPNIINVKAGDTVVATWRHTLTSTEANDATYVIDPSHKGPIMAYMKKVTDSTTDPGYGGGWFKVQEAGLNVATQDWAVTDLIAAGGLHSITIPSCIANGQYLLRPEILALHSASSPQGAQFYMECAQLNVTGGTGAVTPSAVSLPGAYASTDPGILINIYQTLTTYAIPGPTVFSCGGGGPPPTSIPPPPSSTPHSSTTSAPTTLVTSSKPTTAVTTTSKSSTTSTSSTQSPTTTSTGGSPLYGQCGGMIWTGPTTCASGTCKYSNPYYSQCLP